MQLVISSTRCVAPSFLRNTKATNVSGPLSMREVAGSLSSIAERVVRVDYDSVPFLHRPLCGCSSRRRRQCHMLASGHATSQSAPLFFFPTFNSSTAFAPPRSLACSSVRHGTLHCARNAILNVYTRHPHTNCYLVSSCLKNRTWQLTRRLSLYRTFFAMELRSLDNTIQPRGGYQQT